MDSQTIHIGTTPVGDGYPTYIIAEIGINHNGDEETAVRLVEAARDAGANAVKFQKRHLPSLYPREVLEHPERFEQAFQYMIPLLKKVELPDAVISRLRKRTRKLGLDFLCTPFDPVSADFLHELGIDAFKIASADLTNSPLLTHVSGFGKPMVISTGMSHWEEVEAAVALLSARHNDFALLHCRSVYPVWPREVNLRMINRLKRFGVPVGYSGHELGITVSLVAASMGACIIEKHLTLDRRQEGPDHKVSLEPYEFKRLVRDIRIADQAVGKKKRIMLRGEVLNRELFGKSLVAATDIEAGTIITRDMVTVQGPGKGLAPLHLDRLVGRRAKRGMRKGELFLEQDLENGEHQNIAQCFRSNWGLIARFSDYQDMLAHNPKTLEFHLAENDYTLPFTPRETNHIQLVVHAPEYMGEQLLDLCSLDSESRHRSIQATIKALELTQSIAGHFRGTPKLIVHPGAMSIQHKLDKRKLRDNLTRSLETLRTHACCRDIDLLFENLPPYPWYFGGQWKGNYFMDAGEIATFCKEHDIGLCFDLSHAALYCNAKGKDLERTITILLPYTRHLHLADGYGLDGEGVQFGEGDIDLKTILPLFRGFEGTWVPEIWRGHLNGGRGFLQALTYLARYMD